MYLLFASKRCVANISKGRRGRFRSIPSRQTKIGRSRGGRLDLWKHEDDCQREVLFLVEEDDLIEGREIKNKREGRRGGNGHGFVSGW